MNVREDRLGDTMVRIANANASHVGRAVALGTTIANATVDRLMHHAYVVLTAGDSIRLTQATAGKGVTPLA